MWWIEKEVFPAREEEQLVAELEAREFDHRFVEAGIWDVSEIGKHDICRGSCHFVLKAMRSTNWSSEIWGTETDFSFDRYAPHLGSNLISSDFQILSFAEFCWRKDELFSDRQSLFVRPNDGFKSFEGSVVNADRFEAWMNEKRLLCVRDSLPVVVASSRNIECEWRCFVSNARLVAISQYRPGMSRQISADVISFAKEIIQNRPVNPLCYTLDVARSGPSLGVIEIGSALCTAFYEADIGAWVDASKRVASHPSL